MQGHNTIIAARKSHLKPQAIFFEVDLPVTGKKFYFNDPENALRIKHHARVEMSLAEPWRQEDYRFVKGVRCHVHANSWSGELIELANKLAEAGSPHIILICVHDGEEILQCINGEWDE